jgi:hypothetical protein
VRLDDDEIRAIARAVADELRAGFDDHVDQHSSPLGPRRHCAAIRSGKLAGFRVGRRWLAKREDLTTYVAGLSKSSRKPPSAEEALAAELGLSASH